MVAGTTEHYHPNLRPDRAVQLPFYWFPIARSAVAQVRQTRPETSSVLDVREAPFHSPVHTPDSVAVMIMNDCMSPQPIEVPREPRKAALMP